MDMDADLDMDADIDGAGEGLLALLGFGKLPLMLLLALFLMVFGLVGLFGQQFYTSLFNGALLNGWIAAPLAGLVSLPLTGILARPLGAIMPKDETSAVHIDSLVGRRGHIEIGTAKRGSPARAQIKDMHGHLHHVMVEPDNDGQILAEGEEILLVRKEDGNFRAISHGDHYLPRI